MNKENVLYKKPKKDKRSVIITVRIFPSQAKWLKKNNFSPSAIMQEGIKDLGFKHDV